MNDVILVDEKDNTLGRMEKMKAHKEGVLHRAFSIFIFNTDGLLLLQKRNEGKYHSGGLWTNTCCSHPKPGETIQEAALLRLMEEMGIKTDLDFAFSFVYRAEFKNGLTENEFDHVLIGSYNENPKVNPDEVSDWRYESLERIHKELEEYSQSYTEWFKIALPEVEKYLKSRAKTE